MNYQNLKTAKEFYESIADLCDTLDEGNWWEKPEDSSISLREILKRDVAEFIMYLSAADGTIAYEELQVYKMITGFGGDSIQSIRNYIQENNIYSTNFESEPPLIMKLFNIAERNAIMCGADFEHSILESLVDLFEIIGKVLISIDGGITYSEKRDYNIIMRTITEYAADHNLLK